MSYSPRHREYDDTLPAGCTPTQADQAVGWATSTADVLAATFLLSGEDRVGDMWANVWSHAISLGGCPAYTMAYDGTTVNPELEPDEPVVLA